MASRYILHQVLRRKKSGERVPPLKSGPYEVQKFINMIGFLFFFVVCVLESVSGDVLLDIPLGAALCSYNSLICHFLGQLGGHRALGGVRPLHIRHEQAHFLIGPPPLRVQLTVVTK